MKWYSVEVSGFIDVYAKDAEDAEQRAYEESINIEDYTVRAVYDPETGEEL